MDRPVPRARRRQHGLLLAASLPLLLPSMGCRSTARSPPFALRDQGADYAVAARLELDVTLRLTDELRAARYSSDWLMADYELGDQLARGAEELARLLFRRVATTGAAAPAPGGPDGLLTPRVVLVEYAAAATARGDSILTLVLEWRLDDRQGRLAWIDTVRARAIGRMIDHEQKPEALLRQALLLSFRAIRDAPEIRRLASGGAGQAAAPRTPPAGPPASSVAPAMAAPVVPAPPAPQGAAAAAPVAPMAAPAPAYPRRLDGAQIEAHYRAHAFLRANQASKPLDLEVRPDGSLRRDCPRCQRVRAAGSLVLKPESAEVCFYWRRVSYPESGCFQLHQEGPDRFAVRDPGGRAILEYALPP